MHVQPDVVVAHELGSTGVQPHAYAHGRPFRPGVVGQRLGGLGRSGHRPVGGGEGDEEAVALGVHLVPAVGGPDRTQQPLMLRLQRGVALCS